jgi:hypothetical protein
MQTCDLGYWLFILRDRDFRVLTQAQKTTELSSAKPLNFQVKMRLKLLAFYDLENNDLRQ